MDERAGKTQSRKRRLQFMTTACSGINQGRFFRFAVGKIASDHQINTATAIDSLHHRAMNTQAQISPVMHKLSIYIAAARRRPLPTAVIEKTKHHILDTLAAMISGSRLTPGKKAISYVKTLGGAKEAAVIGSKIVTTAVNAALANGMLAHADETDDFMRRR
jgi:hypothetical protein